MLEEESIVKNIGQTLHNLGELFVGSEAWEKTKHIVVSMPAFKIDYKLAIKSAMSSSISIVLEQVAAIAYLR